MGVKDNYFFNNKITIINHVTDNTLFMISHVSNKWCYVCGVINLRRCYKESSQLHIILPLVDIRSILLQLTWISVCWNFYFYLWLWIVLMICLIIFVNLCKDHFLEACSLTYFVCYLIEILMSSSWFSCAEALNNALLVRISSKIWDLSFWSILSI